MPKYSTGNASGDGESCELCGKPSEDLTTATVAGAELDLCSECVPHGEQVENRRSERDNTSSRDDDRERDRGRRAAQNAAKLADAHSGDSTRWEREGTNYDRDQLPYLVSDYGDRARTAREEADIGVEELADELDVDAEDLRAVEEGRAARAGVGGSLIDALEDRLDVTLVDD
jgi:ribosome-binding protein aMBF1 (putative translation factor)